MELIDVLSEEGNPTGEVLGRKEVHDRGLWHKCVHIWILNSEGELLIQKRGKNLPNYPDLWDTSAAGHVSAGESGMEATQKELQEELGLVVEPNELELIGQLKVSVKRRDSEGTNNHFDDVYILRRDLEIENLVLQESEVEGVKFTPWRELKLEIAKDDNIFVKREEEYEILFDYLEKI